MRKPKIWVPTRSDTNRAVQSQKKVRSLKFRIKKKRNITIRVAKTKAADQLRGSPEAGLRFHIVSFPMRWLNYYSNKRL